MFQKLLTFVTAVLFTGCVIAQRNALPVYGITLCGAEFGETNLPGTLGTHYTYPNTSEVAYFAAKGAKTIQLPFKWERIQRQLSGPLDAKELSLITKFVEDCERYGVMVTLVMQNFARYQINGVEYVIGSPKVTLAHYKDVWNKIASVMKNRTNIFAYSIMSEPHDMGGYKWFNAAQFAINGIREVDNKTTILVDGDNYSGPETWALYNDDLKYLKDPANNMMFNAHCYFDEDRSGHYVRSYESSGADEYTGVKRVKPFVDWCRANGKTPFVGEFGVPKNDKRWLTVLDNFLDFLSANNVGGCYWAAGPWWKNYQLSIEPVSKADQPQMFVYAKYLTANSNTAALNNAKTSVVVK
ncbi:MAG: glycosyl hydrolase family 5 [Chitinophaga sp.]|jgi:endoglucanase|nr:glycosyl hydrolase family 5 [Chitinophaga sp.]